MAKKLIKNIIATLLCLGLAAFVLCSTASAFCIKEMRDFIKSGDQHTWDLAVDHDRYIYMVGSTSSSDWNGFLLKTDSDLNEIFWKELGGAYADNAWGIAICPVTNKIYIAWSEGAADGSQRLAISRYNNDGTIDITWGDNGTVTDQVGYWTSTGYSITVAPDGYIYVVGDADTTDGTTDIFLRKYDRYANQIFSKIYVKYGNDSVWRIYSIPDTREIIITGYTDGGGYSGQRKLGLIDTYVIKADPDNGNIRSDTLWGESDSYTMGEGVAANRTGTEIYCSGVTTGSFFGPALGRSDGWVARTDSNLIITLSRNVGDSGEDGIGDVFMDANRPEDLFAVGWQSPPGAVSEDILFAKLGSQKLDMKDPFIIEDPTREQISTSLDLVDTDIWGGGNTYTGGDGWDVWLARAEEPYQVSVEAGTNVVVEFPNVKATFDGTVDTAGTVTMTISNVIPESCGPAPAGTIFLVDDEGRKTFYTLEFTGTYTGTITMTFGVPPGIVPPGIKVVRWDDTLEKWVDDSLSSDVNITEGTVTVTYERELSIFAFLKVEDSVAAIQDVIDFTRSLNLQQGIENSLDAKLENAIRALEKANVGDFSSTINMLGAFINECEAQKGKALTVKQANILINMANPIIASLTTQ